MKNREKVIGIIVLLTIILVFLVVGYFNMKPKKLTQKEMEEMFVEVNTANDSSKNKSYDIKEKDSSKKIVVEIKGEVKKPDVYIMGEGSIVKDLILESGGLTENADLSNINQAKLLSNHDCIVIKGKNIDSLLQNSIPSSSSLQLQQSSNGVININTASKEELDKLPGIGEVTAAKIIEYREKNGSFNNISELKKIDRIGEKLFEKIKDQITVN
ncbi:DNA-binding protein [Clostridium polyendosporum]|uniref:DNA-binding protein n=1 Tax=Clostridium polyendosporum TaxID=69208 RepID=A0A919RZ62_9CLOT|nr:ComEA family DNA-binding protein [Clostridium polyendosporum]GIM29225.1 DNA-binding protein [Clostridium polyendosporum]